MKKLLFIILLGASFFAAASQQKTLGLVMGYRWEFEGKNADLKCEGKCQDGIEFDFENGKAKFYTPDGEMHESLCRITKTVDPVVNADKSTTYAYDLFLVGAEQQIHCFLNVSADYKDIKFTIINPTGSSVVYRVTNMIDHDDNEA